MSVHLAQVLDYCLALTHNLVHHKADPLLLLCQVSETSNTQFVLKMTHFLGQVGPGRASPPATSKALNRYFFVFFDHCRIFILVSSLGFLVQ